MALVLHSDVAALCSVCHAILPLAFLLVLAVVLPLLPLLLFTM
jgi:hypothetical protein